MADGEHEWTVSRAGFSLNGVTVRVEEGGLVLSTLAASPARIAWEAIQRVETGTGAESLAHSGVLAFIENGPTRNAADFYYRGGPWVRVLTETRSLRFSHPAPPELVELIRERCPGAVIGSAALESEPSAAPGATAWTTTFSGLSPDRAMTRARIVGVVFLVCIMLLLQFVSRVLHTAEPRVIVPIMLVPALAVMLFSLFYTHGNTVALGRDGLQLELEPQSRASLRWAALRDVRVRPESDFSWAARRLGPIAPGRRWYFGGDALVLETGNKTYTISVREAHEAAAAIRAGRERALSEGI
ncbi:hypothetical protein [Falsarthrobacter nasiphocae]|uniref:PH domain-containing protein n=1 Tax=Falsarthrobacter nasiphocae TaxID=189863 RepID=A0AAE3YFF8_9MICC|nr:hypothetical protein [Falsarthrobacter nasiphocae]MDR6891200.1 hypothetical protein [Falsarthrobacter nasiphocae]